MANWVRLKGRELKITELRDVWMNINLDAAWRIEASNNPEMPNGARIWRGSVWVDVYATVEEVFTMARKGQNA